MDLDDVADELYGLAPADFIRTRDARAKEARSAGDRDLAAAIKALRKPTTVAWVANRLARRHPDALRQLDELGGQLRSAMAAPSGPELRRLNARQREVVGGLVQRARELAVEDGLPMSEPTVQALTDTLAAALADPEAATALAAGRLTDGLIPPGFGMGLGLAGGPAQVPSADASAARSQEEVAGQREEREQAARLDQARADVTNAEEEVATARRALMHATAALERSSARARRAADHVDALRAELAEATRSRDRAQQQEDDAQAAHDRADEAVGQAERQLRTAVSALDEHTRRP